MNIKMQGVDEAIRAIRAKRDLIGRQLSAGLKLEGELMMTDSKANYVPVDTGTLRASGRVGQPVTRLGSVSVELGYGGAASAYALIQHERMDYHHIVGQAKYLEAPVLNAARGFGSRLAARIRV